MCRKVGGKSRWTDSIDSLRKWRMYRKWYYIFHAHSLVHPSTLRRDSIELSTIKLWTDSEVFYYTCCMKDNAIIVPSTRKLYWLHGETSSLELGDFSRETVEQSLFWKCLILWDWEHTQLKPITYVLIIYLFNCFALLLTCVKQCAFSISVVDGGKLCIAQCGKWIEQSMYNYYLLIFGRIIINVSGTLSIKCVFNCLWESITNTVYRHKCIVLSEMFVNILLIRAVVCRNWCTLVVVISYYTL